MDSRSGGSAGASDPLPVPDRRSARARSSLLPPLLVTAFCLGLLLPRVAPAQTQVGGEIPVDTTWDIGHSPYRAIAHVVVSSGATLTIQPGVEVRLDESCSIFVDLGAALIAEGTPESTIVFTRSGDGHWGTVAGVLADLTLRHCLIEWGSTGVFIERHNGMLSRRATGSHPLRAMSAPRRD